MLREKIYWHVSYRDSLSDSYKQNPELLIAESDIESLESEFECLKKHKYVIIERNYDFGYAVIEEYIKTGENIFETYKTKDLVPYVQFRPIQRLCDINGLLYQNGEEFYQIR
jgi:hypothetical protein